MALEISRVSMEWIAMPSPLRKTKRERVAHGKLTIQCGCGLPPANGAGKNPTRFDIFRPRGHCRPSLRASEPPQSHSLRRFRHGPRIALDDHGEKPLSQLAALGCRQCCGTIPRTACKHVHCTQFTSGAHDTNTPHPENKAAKDTKRGLHAAGTSHRQRYIPVPATSSIAS